ncbi:MAG: hypothetical protein ACK5WS_05315 [Alphaproteobacteria bacterium]|jgi:hypothetical protein
MRDFLYNITISPKPSLPILAFRFITHTAAMQYTYHFGIEIQQSLFGKLTGHKERVYNIVCYSTAYPILGQYSIHNIVDGLTEHTGHSKSFTNVYTNALQSAILSSVRNYNNTQLTLSDKVLNISLTSITSAVLSQNYNYFISSNYFGFAVTASMFGLKELARNRLEPNQNLVHPSKDIICKSVLITSSSLCLMYMGLNQDNLACKILRSSINNIIYQYNLGKQVADLIAPSEPVI